MNEIQLATLLTLCTMILRKLLKFIQQRNSDCGLETPCFKMHLDVENPAVELRDNEHAEHIGHTEHTEHTERGLEEKSSETISLTTESTLSSEEFGDELDFEELTQRLEKIIAD